MGILKRGFMFENFKRLRKIKKNQRVKLAQEFDYTEDGAAIVEVGVKDYEDVISPYCVKSYAMLNPEFARYIYSMTEQVAIREDIEIDIYMENEPSNKRKSNITTAIRTYFAEKIVTLQKSMRATTTKCVIMFILAALTFALMFFIGNSINEVVLEVISVFAWILLWDASEDIFYNQSENRTKLINYYRLLRANIEFKLYDPKELKKQRELLEQIEEQEEQELEEELEEQRLEEGN